MGKGRKPTDSETLAHIRDLVAEEKALRAQLRHGGISESEEQQQLRRIEIELDQVLGPAPTATGIAPNRW